MEYVLCVLAYLLWQARMLIVLWSFCNFILKDGKGHITFTFGKPSFPEFFFLPSLDKIELKIFLSTFMYQVLFLVLGVFWWKR